MIHYFSLFGFFIDFFGKLLVAYTALRVHHRVWQEHKIDKLVFHEMKLEQVLGLLGLFLIIAGFFLQLPGKL